MKKNIQKTQGANVIGGNLCHSKMIALIPLCFAPAVLAADNNTKPSGSAVTLEPITVTHKLPISESLNTTEIDDKKIRTKQAAVSDTAKLLEDTPGVVSTDPAGCRVCPSFTA